MIEHMSRRERAVHWTKATGVLPGRLPLGFPGSNTFTEHVH